MLVKCNWLLKENFLFFHNSMTSGTLLEICVFVNVQLVIYKKTFFASRRLHSIFVLNPRSNEWQSIHLPTKLHSNNWCSG